MAKIVPLGDDALGWARRAFQRYYGGTVIPPPPRFAEREYAAFPFSKENLMRRHAAFPAAGALQDFLREFVPRHVYYSSAYYENPDHPSMPGKGWLGADLIFDLDADHLKQSEGRSYAAQLVLVKEQLKRLYDDFLVGDFGVDPENTALVFSGGRGYHVHVRDERFRSLTSPERRELVDYVMGTEVDPTTAILEERRAGATGESSRAFRRLYPPDEPGWKGRTTRGLGELLLRWESQGSQAAIEDMERAGMAHRDAQRLARLLLRNGHSPKIRERLQLDVFPKDVPTSLLALVLKTAAIEVQGETDAPVTTDIHRLIRLPGSLHGGTGLRAVPLDRDRLDAFDPFVDALTPERQPVATRLTLLERVDHPFETPIRGEAGEAVEVPSPVALFLVLRGEAALRP